MAWRLPSFFEPRWYTDEGGYSVTARMVLGGAHLYSQAWTNKPPFQIWAVAIPFRLFGPSEAGLHALTFLTGLTALLAVAFAARRLVSPPLALAATVLFALAIGPPTFDSQLAVPESLLIAPTTWAGVILALRLRLGSDGPRRVWWRWAWAPAVGVLAGLAIGVQQTCLADAAAFALAIGVGAGAGRIRWLDLATYAAGLVAITAAWLLPSLALAGAHEVWFSLVGFYTSYASFSAPHSHAGLLLRAIGPPLALWGAIACRRSQNPGWALGLWAVAVLEVAALANRNYPHFLTPAMAPGILALACAPGLIREARLRLLPLAAGLVLASSLASVAWIDPKPVQAYFSWPQMMFSGRRLHWATWLDPRTPSDNQAAKYLSAHGLRGASAVAWSSDPWLYLIADLPLKLRTAPIYNDVVLMGSDQAVATKVASLHPEVIVTTPDAVASWPAISPLLKSRYRLAFTADQDSIYLRDT